jgi:CheY-like chemotaxis protein
VALILLIDDDGFYRGVLRQILEDGGHHVTEAANGADGLARFRAQQPDLVITDMRMPGFDGGEVIRKLREMSRDVRILAVSGVPIRDDGEDLPSTQAVGANAILSKLNPLDGVLLTIERILKGPVT